MPDRLLSIKVFVENKKLLDGFVFYRIEEGSVVVRQVSPYRIVSNFLKQFPEYQQTNNNAQKDQA